MKDYEEQCMVQRKMSWVNIQLSFMTLFVVANIALLILIKPIIFRAISFLLVSLFTLVVWYKWHKNIKALI